MGFYNCNHRYVTTGNFITIKGITYEIFKCKYCEITKYKVKEKVDDRNKHR